MATFSRNIVNELLQFLTAQGRTIWHHHTVIYHSLDNASDFCDASLLLFSTFSLSPSDWMCVCVSFHTGLRDLGWKKKHGIFNKRPTEPSINPNFLRSHNVTKDLFSF